MRLFAFFWLFVVSCALAKDHYLFINDDKQILLKGNEWEKAEDIKLAMHAQIYSHKTIKNLNVFFYESYDQIKSDLADYRSLGCAKVKEHLQKNKNFQFKKLQEGCRFAYDFSTHLSVDFLKFSMASNGRAHVAKVEIKYPKDNAAAKKEVARLTGELE